jgi:hypothetical protein
LVKILTLIYVLFEYLFLFCSVSAPNIDDLCNFLLLICRVLVGSNPNLTESFGLTKDLFCRFVEEFRLGKI